jgi:hypothetical protein
MVCHHQMIIPVNVFSVYLSLLTKKLPTDLKHLILAGIIKTKIKSDWILLPSRPTKTCPARSIFIFIRK